MWDGGVSESAIQSRSPSDSEALISECMKMTEDEIVKSFWRKWIQISKRLDVELQVEETKIALEAGRFVRRQWKGKDISREQLESEIQVKINDLWKSAPRIPVDLPSTFPTELEPIRVQAVSEAKSRMKCIEDEIRHLTKQVFRALPAVKELSCDYKS